MRVLVVEDDEASRVFMAFAAKSRGHEVACAEDGGRGLAAFLEFRPDIVISDINMPEMDGLEMLEKIRQVDSESVVIINSTLDSPQYTLKALRLKANDYLVKPVLEKDMLSLLDKYSAILAERTAEDGLPGIVSRRELEIEFPNSIDAIGRIADRMMRETEHAIAPIDRLGIRLGLVELLANAIEHGNLEITYDEKTRALAGGVEGWRKLVETRAGTKPYVDRRVTVEFKMDRARCEWTVTDQGPGFDRALVPDPNDPRNLLTASHGRGIMLAGIQFDELEYIGRGNKVRTVKRLPGFIHRA